LFKRIGSNSLRAADVGANVGIYSRFLSRHFLHCNAFEPLPSLLPSLKRSANSNCTIHNCAIGDFDGCITLRVPLSSSGEIFHALGSASNSNDFGLFEHSGLFEVETPVMRLDTVLGEAQDLGFVKIDVEGFELAVINGATSILSHQRPIWQIEICMANNPEYAGVLNTMEAAGYKMFGLSPEGLVQGCISQIEEQPKSLFLSDLDLAHKFVWDFLFVPKEDCSKIIF
jgi:FkbM family methyltransferase